jgi:hypothetical protein
MQILSTDTDNLIRVYLESDTILPGTYVNAEYNIPSDYRAQQLDRIADKFVTYPVKNAVTGYTTNTKIISTQKDVNDHFKDADDKYFVTGYTDSKFGLISKFFKKTDISNISKKSNNLRVSSLVGDDAGKPNNSEFVTLVGDNSGKPTIQPENLDQNIILRTGIKFVIPGLDISAMILVDDPVNPEYVLYLDTENPIKYIDFGGDYTIFKYMRSNIEQPESANIILYEGFIEEPKIISEVFIDRGLNSGFEKVKKLKNVTSLNELNKMGLGYYKINKKGYNFKNI